MVFENISILSHLNLLSIIVRLSLALILGGIIGMERQQKQRPAGFRTYIIVCLGATLACITNVYMVTYLGGGDPARIPAQVISGIGFLGAGTILVTRNSHVKGLTTAAGLWSVATIGVAVGCGFYTGAIICTLAIEFSLAFLMYFDKKLSYNSKYISFYAEFSDSKYIKELITYAKKESISMHDLDMFKAPDSQNIMATFTIQMKNKTMRDEISDKICNFNGLIFIEEL